MLYYFFDLSASEPVTFAAAILGFVLTFVLLKAFADKLPSDIGRAYAVNAAAAKGKPRGAGVVFVVLYGVLLLIFTPVSLESATYIALLVITMLSGFLDDASKSPWGEYKKGLIDLGISVFISLVFVLNNSTDILLPYTGRTFSLPVWLYVILGTILVWSSINVVNCTDGVDGLSTTLSLITFGGFIVLFSKESVYAHIMQYLPGNDIVPWMYIFMGVLAGYLLMNAGPSIMLMGDAGSRTIGVLMALVAMKSGCPLMFLLLCLVFIIDGGLGLIKVSLLRFLKIHILKNTRTPIHDHVRKNLGWSDAQTVLRFSVLHLIVVFAALYLIR